MSSNLTAPNRFMKIKDVKWTKEYNVFTIECDCGNIFQWPAIYSVAQCLNCLKENVLHENEKYHPGIAEKNLEVASIDLTGCRVNGYPLR